MSTDFVLEHILKIGHIRDRIWKYTKNKYYYKALFEIYKNLVVGDEIKEPVKLHFIYSKRKDYEVLYERMLCEFKRVKRVEEYINKRIIHSTTDNSRCNNLLQINDNQVKRKICHEHAFSVRQYYISIFDNIDKIMLLDTKSPSVISDILIESKWKYEDFVMPTDIYQCRNVYIK